MPFKTFYRLLELLYTAFALNATIKAARFAAEILAHPGNKLVICEPELNL